MDIFVVINIGMGIKCWDVVDVLFIMFNNSVSVEWIMEDKINGMKLIVVLCEIIVGIGNIGNFCVKVIFNFIYE